MVMCRFLLWNIYFACYFLYITLSTPPIKTQLERGITFPNEYFDDCFINEKQLIKGRCKKLSDCPSALNLWITQKVRPKTCYFNKFDQIVCCEATATHASLNLPQVLSSRRRSELECKPELNLPPPPPPPTPALTSLRETLSIDDLLSVVHGELTKPNEFPYMIALGWKSNSSKNFYRCGGSLISKTFVLTAAHCTDFEGVNPDHALIGGVDLTDRNALITNIKRIIVHPDYDYITSYNDIALIELTEVVNKTPVCLWSQYDVPNLNITAIGYGNIKFAGNSSDQLLKANLHVITNNICAGYYTDSTDTLNNGVVNTQICAGDPEHLRDTCQGDSGGPIIMKFGDGIIHDYVIGTTSFGQGCAGEPPSIYTRTSAYIDWIEDIVWPVN